MGDRGGMASLFLIGYLAVRVEIRHRSIHSFKSLIVKVCIKLCSSFTRTESIVCDCSDSPSANTSSCGC